MLPIELLEYIECGIPHRCAHKEDATKKCSQCDLKYSFIVKDPVILQCEHQICQECEPKASQQVLKCKICAAQSSNAQVVSSGLKNKLVDKTIKDHLGEMYAVLKDKFKTGQDLFLEHKIELETSVEAKRQILKNEVDVNIEKLRGELEKVRFQLYDDVDKYCGVVMEKIHEVKFVGSIMHNIDEENEKGDDIEEIIRQKNFDKVKFYELQKKLKEMLDNVQNCYDLVFDLRFENNRMHIKSVGDIRCRIRQNQNILYDDKKLKSATKPPIPSPTFPRAHASATGAVAHDDKKSQMHSELFSAHVKSAHQMPQSADESKNHYDSMMEENPLRDTSKDAYSSILKKYGKENGEKTRDLGFKSHFARLQKQINKQVDKHFGSHDAKLDKIEKEQGETGDNESKSGSRKLKNPLKSLSKRLPSYLHASASHISDTKDKHDDDKKDTLRTRARTPSSLHNFKPGSSSEKTPECKQQ